MVDTVACAAKTRSRETRPTDEQWLVSTLNLETQVCEKAKSAHRCFYSCVTALPPMEAWFLTRFSGT
jgi:hypothetical protein